MWENPEDLTDRQRDKPAWTSAARSVDAARTIDAALEHDLSNALAESTNTKIRPPTRMAFGFKSADALIAPAMPSLGGFRPDLPGPISP